MARKDPTFEAVRKGLNSTKGLTKAQQAELDKRRIEGEKRAANDRARRNNQTKAMNKKAEREYEKRWAKRGGDDVTDTGMFN